MSRYLIKLTVITCLLFIVGAVSPATAATINVTASAPDALTAGDGSCSLREAIMNINAGADTTGGDCVNSGAYGTNDTIIVPTGTYRNAIWGGTPEDANVSGDLDILKSVTIQGAGAASTIIDGLSGNLNERVLDVHTGNITIDGVTITNGFARALPGGGVRASNSVTITNSTISGNVTAAVGGGVFAVNSAIITNSTISGNRADIFDGGGVFAANSAIITNSTISGNNAAHKGGGVFGGTATITNSTISGNTAASACIGCGGITSGYGGGVYAPISATITNSTISGNHAAIEGGGVLIDIGGTATITNSTISGNHATTGGGVFIMGSVTATITNSIVANNLSGGDCGGGPPFTSGGNNISSDATCSFVAMTDQVSTDPLLGPLANNGGPTFTHALLPGSPAIDAGDATTCANAAVNGMDQRGVTRPQGAGCDIGAFEFEFGPLPVVGLNVNAPPTYATGSAMTLTASTTPSATPANADVYVALQLPDGTLLVMQPGGGFGTTLTPLLRNIPVPSFTGPIFNYTFSGTEPVGNYTWFAALSTPGTVNVIGTLATAPFSFTP